MWHSLQYYATIPFHGVQFLWTLSAYFSFAILPPEIAINFWFFILIIRNVSWYAFCWRRAKSAERRNEWKAEEHVQRRIEVIFLERRIQSIWHIDWIEQQSIRKSPDVSEAYWTWECLGKNKSLPLFYRFVFEEWIWEDDYRRGKEKREKGYETVDWSLWIQLILVRKILHPVCLFLWKLHWARKKAKMLKKKWK